MYRLMKKVLPARVKALIPPKLKRQIITMMNIDTSQHGEVSYLTELISEDFPRYLVDVGAHDGITTSNSRFLIVQGWEAIMIEPLPKVFELLQETYHKNHNVRCVNKACSNVVGTQRLFVGADGERGFTSTLCTDNDDWFDKSRTNRSMDVEVDTLTRILSSNAFPKDFSLLCIDAEGMDYEVLLGLNFELFEPRIIVTEEYTANLKKLNSKHQLLMENNYVLCRQLGVNTIWIRKELLKSRRGG